MTTPLLRKRRVLAAKIETTVGTAISMNATDATFNIMEPEFQPTIEFVAREGQGVFSPLPGTLAAYGGTVSFRHEVYGRGSSGASVPAWASTFLPACGLVDNASGLFQLKSNPPGTAAGTKTLTIRGYQDGVLKQLRGCMGNAVFTFQAGRVAFATFTFTGIWDEPTDAAILAPTYETISPLRFASAQMTLGGSPLYNPKVAEMTLDLGNNVVLREDPNDESGYCAAVITDRSINGTFDPESSLVATEDNYGKWIARTEEALAMQLGSGLNRVDFDAPKLQFTNLQEADRNGVMTDTINYQLNRSAAAGDDELTIDFN